MPPSGRRGGVTRTPVTSPVTCSRVSKVATPTRSRFATSTTAFATIAGARVARERTALLTALLQRASPDEARYIAKLITAELRIGLREGLVEEAIAVAFGAEPAAVSRAVMLTGDLGEAALLARAGRLDDAAPRWFVPLRSMLATPVADAAEAVARLGEDVWVEDKYDGIRCQLHRRGADVALYSRDLKNISAQFPEITDAAIHLRSDVMLDGEILAFHDGRVMPFHALQTRLGRVAPDAAVMAAVPVIYVAWDVLMVDDEVLIDHPLRERRARLEALAVPHPLALAHLERVRGAAEIDRRFDDARARLNEGLLLKQPELPYTPGRRGLNWLKLKRSARHARCRGRRRRVGPRQAAWCAQRRDLRGARRRHRSSWRPSARRTPGSRTRRSRR